MPIKKRIKSLKAKFTNRSNGKTHKSFSITKKRDYKRDLNLPGYFSFTAYVFKTLAKNRKLFTSLTLLVLISSAILIGFASQTNYMALVDTLDSTSGDLLSDVSGKIGGAGLLFLASISGGVSQSLSTVQQLYLLFIIIFTWLTTVWLLRNILSGNSAKLRDGIYNAGSPIIATMLLTIVMIVQFFPFVIALIGYAAASSTGLLDGGVEAMLFWIVAGLLSTLSLYWMSSTFFAMVIATIPGMYPMKALHAAGGLVAGRRVRIIKRLLWLGLVTCLAWAVIFIPVILIDMSIKSIWAAIEWLPIIPLLISVASSMTIIWVSAYIYLLYRKIVDNES